MIRFDTQQFGAMKGRCTTHALSSMIRFDTQQFGAMKGRSTTHALSSMIRFDTQQFGAMKGRYTTHALSSMLHLWSDVLDHGQSVGAHSFFVDYSKAFDHIDHTLLLNKLIYWHS